jgi:endothelin-converting enzyme/putative endopeptidase
MRALRFLMILLSGSTLAAQTAGQHGIQTRDLDKKCDPCTDFAQYASGTWHAQNPIPAYMDRWSRRWQAGEQAKDQLRVILDQVSSRADWPRGSVEQLIGDYYGSCMDEGRINQLGLTPAQPMLKKIREIKSESDLQRTILTFHEQGMFVPFGLRSRPDNHNPTETIADVFAGGLGLPDRDYYLKPEPRFQEAREKYRVHVATMFNLAGYGEKSAQAASETVFGIEEKLAEKSLDNVALRDPVNTDHKMSYVAFTKLAPAMDWDAYFASAKISRADLNVSEPDFIREVDRQLRETPLADWKTYLTWHLINAKADALSEVFVKENFAFQGKYLSGATEIKPRWKRCAESTDQLLGEALGKKYVEKYFSPEAKARAQEMVTNIIAAMHDTIEGLSWMGPETKKKALEKLSTLNPKIGYPDKWKDYSSIALTRDSFWNNLAAATRWNVIDDDWNLIGKPTDRGRWGMTPPTSNAYYNARLNEIVFPAGILQPPAFDVHAVDAVNYGSIGVVIGHEISHGFDDKGAKYDAQGRLRNWWTPEDQKRFEEKTACVARQFDGYFIEPNIHHNGELVLGESIADLAGVKIAYLALKKAQEKHPAPSSDGFTADQQFFIAWGQFRADEIRPETQRKMVQGDPHPIAKYRVIGPLSNLTAFAEAFGCKKDSAMVRAPAERCELW